MGNVAKKKMGRPIIGEPKNIDLRIRVDLPLNVQERLNGNIKHSNLEGVKYSINNNEKESNYNPQIEELVDEYGGIPKGETPARNIKVPLETPKGKVKQFYRTILESPQATTQTIQVLQEEIINGNATYKPYLIKN